MKKYVVVEETSVPDGVEYAPFLNKEDAERGADEMNELKSRGPYGWGSWDDRQAGEWCVIERVTVAN